MENLRPTIIWFIALALVVNELIANSALRALLAMSSCMTRAREIIVKDKCSRANIPRQLMIGLDKNISKSSKFLSGNSHQNS